MLFQHHPDRETLQRVLHSSQYIQTIKLNSSVVTDHSFAALIEMDESIGVTYRDSDRKLSGWRSAVTAFTRRQNPRGRVVVARREGDLVTFIIKYEGTNPYKRSF